MNRVQAVWASFRAEFFKICAFRFPLYAGGGLVLFVGLVTFNLIRAEGLLSHLQVTGAISILPHLAWASWGKLVVIPVFLIAFATYCTVVDSQYGMIRIGCSQPVTRMGYAAAKTAAILAHSAILMLAYAALLLCASAVTVGRWTITWNEVVDVLVFCERLLILGIGIAWLVTAAALIRRTLLSGFVTAILVIIGFA